MKTFLHIIFIFLISAFGSCSGGGGKSNDSVAGQPSFPSISLEEIARGIIQPTHITHADDGSGRIFAVERGGKIRIIRNNTVLSTPFLDITGKVTSGGSEQGLLSVAFPPGYAGKGYFYVNYTSVPDGNTIVARYRLSGPDSADPLSEEVVLTVAQPFANHNGGQLAFGPDGFLYIGMGDGGSGGDPQNNAQNPASLLGKILRVDAESTQSGGYLIPPSNPFFGNDAFRAEIWALGLRNPWRFSFDRSSGDLYIADVGQSAREEVNFQAGSGTGGDNYGWNIMEGSRCFLDPECSSGGLVLPVAEYDQSLGDCSVTGGFVYRGAEFPQMQGVYFFGDFCSGRIRAIRRNGPSFATEVLLKTDLRISTFGEDQAGNLYIADYPGGSIHKLIASE